MSIKIGSRIFDTVDDVESLVVHAATQYDLNGYVEDFDNVEVTDPEYDELLRYLRNHKPSSKAFQGTKPSTAKAKGATVVHDPPMTSIAKADGDDQEKPALYDRWVADCAKRLKKRPALSQSYKRDGVALRVNYENGELVSAGLRPRDGVNGSDVTRHMKYIKGVPQTLALPLTLSLNGEIECWLADFEAVNKDQVAEGEDPYKNPRNYTAGCLGRDDPEENKNSRLRICWYGITGFDQWRDYYKSEVERAKWANSKKGLGLQDENGKGFFVQVLPHQKYDQLLLMEQHAKKLPYYTDGVVLKVDDLDDQEELGHIGDDPVNDPRGALAWKYTEQTAEAVVSSVEWNASRTGRVVPTAIFDKPFVLADTENRRATCNNYGWMESQGLGPGATVKCKKGGKIIPNIMEVLKPVKSVGAPTECPTCGGKLRINTSTSGNKDLFCPNKECGAKHINSWLHYFQKMGGKGLGPAAMELILKGKLVTHISDFYRLDVTDLTADDRFTKREALLALATIHMVQPLDDDDDFEAAIEKARTRKHKVQAWRFFQALGIPGAGESAGKALMGHLRDFEKIRKASVDQLLKVDGIGQTTADAIAEWFAENDKVVDELLCCIELEQPKKGKLTGMNFCLTGDFTKGKKFYKDRIEAEGGNCQSGVSKTTNYCVYELSTGTGNQTKAAKLGVETITPKELEKML